SPWNFSPEEPSWPTPGCASSVPVQSGFLSQSAQPCALPVTLSPSQTTPPAAGAALAVPSAEGSPPAAAGAAGAPAPCAHGGQMHPVSVPVSATTQKLSIPRDRNSVLVMERPKADGCRLRGQWWLHVISSDPSIEDRLVLRGD